MATRIKREVSFVDEMYQIRMTHSHEIHLVLPWQSDMRYSPDELNLTIRYPPRYPFSPPTIIFDSHIFHPNVDMHGRLVCQLLKSDWTPTMMLHALIETVRSLLYTPLIAEPPTEDNGKQEEKECPCANEVASSVWYDLDIFMAHKLQYDELKH